MHHHHCMAHSPLPPFLRPHLPFLSFLSPHTFSSPLCSALSPQSSPPFPRHHHINHLISPRLLPSLPSSFSFDDILPLDVLLDCNRVQISDILSSPQPTFIPRKGLLDSDEDVERMKKDNTAAFYRSKLRALISGKKDPSTGYAGTFGNRPGGTPVQFGIARTPRNSPSSYEHLASQKSSGMVFKY